MSLQEEPGKSAVSPMDGSSLQQLDEKHNIYTYSRSTQMYAASLTVRVINNKKHIYNSISQNSLKIAFYIFQFNYFTHEMSRIDCLSHLNGVHLLLLQIHTVLGVVGL